MPIMDGFESVKNMRNFEHQNGKGSRKCIVGMSANSEEQMVELARQAGMDAMFFKPFRIQNLIAIYENDE